MKCIQNLENAEDVRRVPDKQAAEMVASGGWQYVARQVWKAVGRPGKVRQ